MANKIKYSISKYYDKLFCMRTLKISELLILDQNKYINDKWVLQN